MRSRDSLVRNVGDSIEDFVGRALFSLERVSFEERLSSYLRDQHLEVEMGEETMNTLFDIAVQFLKEKSAALNIKKARLEQDLKTQRRLTIAVKKHLSEAKKLAETSGRITGKPHTSLLARSLLRKTNELLGELEDVAQILRARQLRLPMFMRSAKNEKSMVWELDAYLQHRIPWLQAEQRGLVIAGTMIASGMKSDADGKDYASNVPMARSRAKRWMEGEEPSVIWLDQIPLPEPAKGERSKPSRMKKVSSSLLSSAKE